MANTPYYSKAEADQKNKETFREVERTVQSISAGEGGKSFATLADAQAVSPVPSDGTVFQVEEFPNAGYYKYDSNESNGTKFLKEFVDIIEYSAGKNKINPAKIIYNSRYYDTPGSVFQNTEEASGWNRMPLIKIKPSTTYTLSDINTSYVGNIYDSNFNRVGIISQSIIQGAITFTTNSKGLYLGVNLKSSEFNQGNQIQLEEGDVKTSYKEYIKGILKKQIIDFNDYARTYVSLDITGSSTENERFSIYTRNKNTDEYLCFNVEHEVIPEIYSDQWRLVESVFYKYDGVSMTPINLKALTSGESESVYKRQNFDDFSGGYHGDEIVTNIKFYIDNIKIQDGDLLNFDLKPCDEFSYRQISTVHTAPFQGVEAQGNPVEAIRHKITKFQNMSYETFCRYIWQIDINDFESFFLNMSSIALDIGEYGENFELENVLFNEDGSRRLKKKGKWIRQYSPQNNTAVVIESETNINDDIAEQQIWDVSAYHKYYRDVNPERNLIANAGDIWEGKTKVTFYKS